MQQAENERKEIQLKLVMNLLEKEKELSQLKETNHKLELEIKDLVCANQKLEMVSKDQQVLLHQKDKELAEHKLTVAEEKKETCERDLVSQRRMSVQLQEENHHLKRQISDYQQQTSLMESPAKRSKTD